jgi:hypothetical protein
MPERVSLADHRSVVIPADTRRKLSLLVDRYLAPPLSQNNLLSAPALPLSVDRIQGRLLALAGLFLGLYALVLTLSPAARARSWSEPPVGALVGVSGMDRGLRPGPTLTGRYLPTGIPSSCQSQPY